MNPQITNQDVKIAARRYALAAKRVGLLEQNDGVYVDHGSRTYGVANYVWVATRNGSRVAPGIDRGKAGFSKREVCDLLYAVAVAFEAVAYARENSA